MTDRINSITLVLSKDTRIDDAEPLIEACKQFGRVVDVVPNLSENWAAMSERSRLIAKLSKGLYKLLGELRE